MRYALIKNGIVTNVIEASESFVQGLVARGEIHSYELDGSMPSRRKTHLTRLEFMQRFTSGERQAILTETKSNVAIEDLWEQMNAASFIDIDRPDTIAGVQALEMLTLIGTGRAAEILA